VTYNGKIYGVPMDFHANLWHVNMDIMEQAGLVEGRQAGAAVEPGGAARSCQDGQGKRPARTI
jgi:multiple sugar transport system substrate-binding protein